ncbi:MAG: response regulator [Planctomycetia bacterium]|nr:response regulator [Planctomycetia bacterium]
MSTAQILVVEDERIVARGIQRELQDMGYAVPELASTGEEAVQKADRLRPDLVLMDIVLKGQLDGIEAARTIRERFDIPVIYLSAYEDENTLGRARLTEPFGYLLKPYEEKELHTTIEMALHKHRMEQQIRHAERWLHATLRSIDDAVLATDAHLAVRFVNPIGEALSGWDATDAFGRELADVCQLRDERSGHPVDNLAGRAIRESVGVDLPEHLLLLSRDARRTPVEGHVAPIHDDHGVFIGVVLVLRDVSQRRQLEELRRQSEEQRRQAERMQAVSRLAGGIAHDFNNLLTVILGNTTLAAADLPADDTKRELLGQAEAAAARAAGLVEQLLGFSGQAKLALKPLNLNLFIEEILGALRRTLTPSIALEFQPGPELWLVQADTGQLREVLLNLALNAQDAMPQGGRLTVETRNLTIDPTQLGERPKARAGDYVLLRVRDTGRGIAQHDQPHLFEPFFSTKPSPGAGLGLALVHGVVEQHHGWIECDSTVREGTDFDIYLPRYWQRAVREPQPASAAQRTAGPSTVLIADDEPMLRELGQTVLEAQGYRVLTAEDGQQALETYQQHWAEIDLVILDLTMPRLSGKDAFHEMLDINPEARVLFSSGYFAEDLTEAEGGAWGFINKPYHPNELIQKVREVLAVPNGEQPG